MLEVPYPNIYYRTGIFESFFYFDSITLDTESYVFEGLWIIIRKFRFLAKLGNLTIFKTTLIPIKSRFLTQAFFLKQLIFNIIDRRIDRKRQRKQY